MLARADLWRPIRLEVPGPADVATQRKNHQRRLDPRVQTPPVVQPACAVLANQASGASFQLDSAANGPTYSVSLSRKMAEVPCMSHSELVEAGSPLPTIWKVDSWPSQSRSACELAVKVAVPLVPVLW